jgi:hypothetical protein
MGCIDGWILIKIVVFFEETKVLNVRTHPNVTYLFFSRLPAVPTRIADNESSGMY